MGDLMASRETGLAEPAGPHRGGWRRPSPHAAASGHDGTGPVWAGPPSAAARATLMPGQPWSGCGTSVMAKADTDRGQPRRRVVLILSPAATTATAGSRPGERVSRSIGPETDVAAITFPPCPRTGADTDATPGSRSATLAAHPRRRTWDSAVAV